MMQNVLQLTVTIWRITKPVWVVFHLLAIKRHTHQGQPSWAMGPRLSLHKEKYRAHKSALVSEEHPRRRELIWDVEIFQEQRTGILEKKKRKKRKATRKHARVVRVDPRLCVNDTLKPQTRCNPVILASQTWKPCSSGRRPGRTAFKSHGGS